MYVGRRPTYIDTTPLVSCDTSPAGGPPEARP